MFLHLTRERLDQNTGNFHNTLLTAQLKYETINRGPSPHRGESTGERWLPPVPVLSYVVVYQRFLRLSLCMRGSSRRPILAYLLCVGFILIVVFYMICSVTINTPSCAFFSSPHHNQLTDIIFTPDIIGMYNFYIRSRYGSWKLPCCGIDSNRRKVYSTN